MNNIDTIQFNDTDTGEDAVVIVRSNDAKVAVCISLSSNGDIEVFMNRETASRLLDALSVALQEH